MKPDPIRQLLSEADTRQVADVSEVDKLVEAVVWRADRRRQRRRTMLSVGSTLTIIAGAMIGLLAVHSHHNHAIQPDVASVVNHPGAATQLSEWIALKQQIKAQEQEINQSLAVERLNQADARLTAILPDKDANPIERAAAAMVRQGDRLREAGLTHDASESYGQVINYFPKTSGSEAARQRLIALESKG